MEDSMKKHEAFQFLVKRRSTNLERKISRKEQMMEGTVSVVSCEGVSVEIEGLRLSPPRLSLDDEDTLTEGSPAYKRRGEYILFRLGHFNFASDYLGHWHCVKCVII